MTTGCSWFLWSMHKLSYDITLASLLNSAHQYSSFCTRILCIALSSIQVYVFRLYARMFMREGGILGLRLITRKQSKNSPALRYKDSTVEQQWQPRVMPTRNPQWLWPRMSSSISLMKWPTK